MKLRVMLFADFAEKMPPEQDMNGAAEIAMPEGATVGDVLDRFDIPHETAYTILLDGRHAKKSVPIPEGAELCVFPPIVGG